MHDVCGFFGAAGAAREELFLMQIDNFDLDMLREVANVGAGNAASALSVMTGQSIDIRVPTCELLTYPELAERLGGADSIMLAMLVKISGDVDGFVLFMQRLPQARETMRTLAGLELPEGDINVANYEPMREIANILVGTYISSIAEMAGISIIPSVPEITIDMAMAIMNVPVLLYGAVSDEVLMMEAEFLGFARDLNGAFYLVPTPESLEFLKKALLGNL